MSRLAAVVLAVVVAAIAVTAVALLLLPRHETAPPIATGAIGVWRESGPGARYRLTIARDTTSADGGARQYSVTYPRAFKVPFPARLVQNEIEIWGENDQDVMWVASYDPGTDTLTLTRLRSGETHAFTRVGK